MGVRLVADQHRVLGVRVRPTPVGVDRRGGVFCGGCDRTHGRARVEHPGGGVGGVGVVTAEAAIGERRV